MKKRKHTAKLLTALCLSVFLTVPSAGVCYAALEGVGTAAGEEAAEETVIEIRDAGDFLAFAENCSYDIWSTNKTIRLMADIDLSGASFEGIPYFNGTFDGNGYTIAQFSLEEKGSDFGFFRYIGASGVVENLNVAGVVKPAGSRKNIGGLAGVNYGTIRNCSFQGSVSGENVVGAIAGINKATGKIVFCESNAVVLATNDTGGIAGINEGIIADCSSKSSINTEELETTLDVGGVDLGTLNLTQNVVSRNNMGGIAGSSTGVIQSCENYGTVGFLHTGYNVGGIAGSQRGVLIDCCNEGSIFGRKDVGGIAGQAEPYIESEYLEDKVEETREDITRLNQTLSGISSSISSTSTEARIYADRLTEQYTVSLDRISENLEELSGAVSDENPQAQGYAENISQALDNINEIGASGDRLTEEQIDAVSENLGVIQDNLENLQGAYAGTDASAEDLVNSISEELKKNSRQEETESLAEIIDNGIQSVTNGINSAVRQMDDIVTNISGDLSVITGEEDYIEDISSIETAENTDGVISGCINRGEVTGDLNVGGIAGTMNIEYDGDPEFDMDLTGTVNITIRSTVNDVIIHSINNGKVTAKKNCAGGICGLQAIGFLFDCENYGQVKSEAGNYLGGITGRSAAAIQNSYSLCNLYGTDYVGGICGAGYTVTDCVSICSIDSEGERIGSIAGMLETEGTVKGNYFVKETYEGIDNISYAGVAEPLTYEEVMELEGRPEGFSRVTVTFETEDEILAVRMLAYGGSISEEDFPEVPEKEGCYIVWPKEDTLQNIRKNLNVTAEYVPWTESLASAERSEDGRELFLVSGEFYKDAKLITQVCAGPEEAGTGAVTAYAYRWSIDSAKGKEIETVEGHFYAPGGVEHTQLWIERDGVWEIAKTGEDGSYLTAALPYGAAFAVVTVPTDDAPYVIAGAAAAILCLAFFVIWIYAKKKKTAGKKQKLKKKK